MVRVLILQILQLRDQALQLKGQLQQLKGQLQQLSVRQIQALSHSVSISTLHQTEAIRAVQIKTELILMPATDATRSRIHRLNTTVRVRARNTLLRSTGTPSQQGMNRIKTQGYHPLLIIPVHSQVIIPVPTRNPITTVRHLHVRTTITRLREIIATLNRHGQIHTQHLSVAAVRLHLHLHDRVEATLLHPVRVEAAHLHVVLHQVPAEAVPHHVVLLPVQAVVHPDPATVSNY
jgi:hypothetical protein